MKHNVSIQPQDIRDVLSDDEMNVLMDIIDKLLETGKKLEIKYFPFEETIPGHS